MSLIYDTSFQIGAICLLLGLFIIYFSNDENYPRYTISILQGLGLGFVCVPIFESPRIYSVIIFLIWIIPMRIGDILQQSSESEKE